MLLRGDQNQGCEELYTVFNVHFTDRRVNSMALNLRNNHKNQVGIQSVTDVTTT